MEYLFFVFEYTLFFLYVYSFIIINVPTTMLTGWWVLLITHFLMTVYCFMTVLFRISEPVALVLLFSFITTLISLFLITFSLQNNYNQPDPALNNQTRLYLTSDKQYTLSTLYDYTVTNICLLMVVLFLFKSRVAKYMFPLVIYRKSEYTIAAIEFVSPKNYSYFLEYLIPWICGSAQLASIAISSYILYLAVDF